MSEVPEGIKFDPCRCSSVKAWGFYPERNMWVHGSPLVPKSGCLKPCGAHRGNNPICFECGEVFTYVRMPDEPEKYPFCPNCS